jgi:hypothetical protein
MVIWPFILMTLGLTIGLGFVISKMEKEAVMRNWAQRRCELPIMTAASFFKPQDDPRTSSEFAKDNFSFCMDQLVKEITSDILSPLMDVFSKHGTLANILGTVLNDIRFVVKVIYDQFMSFISEFLAKYENVAQQVRTVTLHLKQAFQRTNAIILSVVFMGLSVIKGIMNSVDFIIKVVLIICGIMIAIIIILFFILFPFMPIIIGVLAAIIAVAVGSIAGEASSYKSGFCFAPDTMIEMSDGSTKPIQQIQIGDKLANNTNVESVLKMSGKGVPLWRINNIFVSGSHLIESAHVPDSWHPVSMDIRAKKTSYTEGYIYCLNTSTHIIPVKDIENKIIQFRDWEEIRENDEQGQYIWNYNILSKLNEKSRSTKWTDSVQYGKYYPACCPQIKVVTKNGYVQICELSIGDKIIDQNGNETEVLGIIQTITECPIFQNDNWYTSMIEKHDINQTNKVWIRQKDYTEHTQKTIGYNLITNEGTFMIFDPHIQTDKHIFRDFTEIGHMYIEDTNICVENRLRLPTSS